MSDRTVNAAGAGPRDRGSAPEGEGPGSSGERDHWLVRPSTIRRLWIAFFVILAGTLAPDFFVEQYDHFGVETYFGFYAGYGFLTCVLMVVGAKGLGLLIKRGDDYYGD